MAIQKSNFTFTSSSKKKVPINCFKWRDDAVKPVGVCIITHGLSENVEMFEETARFLAENGYICVGMDFLGHGTTNGPGCMGITPNDTNKAIWKDMYKIYSIVREEYPDLPVFSFSHSMGAMMIRAFLAMYADKLDIKACFLTGNSALPPFGYMLVLPANILGNILTRYDTDLKKRRETFKMTDYGQNVPFARLLPFFWLSFDKQNRINYINNPYSGGPNSDPRHLVTFVVKALSTFVYADKKGWAEKIPDNTVIHQGCGQWDIAGFLGLGPKIVHKNLQKAGKKTELHLYTKAMHEVHAEMGIREEFHRDLLKLFNDNNPLMK